MPVCPQDLTHSTTSNFLASPRLRTMTPPRSPGGEIKKINSFANSGIVRKPLISVHGTLDALITPTAMPGHTRP